MKICYINYCSKYGYYYDGKYDKDAYKCIRPCIKSWYIKQLMLMTHIVNW